MNILNNFLFIVLPYMALIVFFVGSIYRYRSVKFTYSSLSSQFLEGRKLFWGVVPFHFGLLIVFFGHLIAFLFPAATLAWNSHPVRLIILEVSAFACGLCVLVGFVGLFTRRILNERVRMVTNWMDIVVELLILVQVVFGLWIALGYRWGSSWFAADLTPYLWSIFKLNPEIKAVSAMPWVIQTHIVGAFLLVLIIPFSRLVHFLVAPLHYLWRPYQLVIWNWNRKKVRHPGTPWSETRPKNT